MKKRPGCMPMGSRARRWPHGWVLLAMGLLAGGCDQNPSPPAQTPAPAEPIGEVVREWRPTPPPAEGVLQRALGEPCETHGAAECASGLCVRTATRTRLCSRQCTATSECPSGWGCVAAVPGGSEHLCLPRPASR